MNSAEFMAKWSIPTSILDELLAESALDDILYEMELPHPWDW